MASRLPILQRCLLLAGLILSAGIGSPAWAARISPPARTPPPPAQPQAVGNPIPLSGDQRLLVILADFSDRAGLFTGQAWQTTFFDNYGFSGYFRQVSYDQLRYTGDIVGLSGGTPRINDAGVAYVRLPFPLSYYADGQYGFKVEPGQFPKNHGGVVYHALQALDAAGFNFAPYANDANQVENVVVIFAGSNYRETADPNNSLEATAYRLTWARDGAGPYTTTGGQVVDNYTFCPDQRGNLTGLQAFIGVCVHEHGHGLGNLDLYDFSYTTAGAGYFDVMASGAYGAPGSSGSSPFQFGAFSKEFFHWITPTVAVSGTARYRLTPNEIDPNVIKLYPNGNSASPEYFLLEFRHAQGFDQQWQIAGLCRGMIIWHVDQDIVQNYPYTVNTLASAGGPPHQGVTVVESDGRYDLINPPLQSGECSDSWQAGQTWNADSTPNSNLWDGSPSHLSVQVLSECTNGGGFLLEIRVGGSTAAASTIQTPHSALTDTLIFLPLVNWESC